MKAKNKKKRTKRIRPKQEYTPRHPRPLGLTNYLIQYHQNPNPQHKQEQLQKIKQLIINQWTANGMTINNKMYTFEDLSTYLNLPVHIIQLQANKQMMRIARFMDDEKTKDWTRAQFFRAFNLGLETQSLIHQQASLLLASQGDTYQPFISGEVNRALNNLISAQKPIHDLLRLTMEKSTTNILIQNGPIGEANNGPNLTADEAVRIIRTQQQSMLEDPSLLEAKEQALLEAPDGLPNINARTQDLASIGLKNSTEYEALKAETPAGHTDADRHRKRNDDDVLDYEDFQA